MRAHANRIGFVLRKYGSSIFSESADSVRLFGLSNPVHRTSPAGHRVKVAGLLLFKQGIRQLETLALAGPGIEQLWVT
jgi:hypothetical protein